MHFIKLKSQKEAEVYLLQELKAAVQHYSNVTWLVSGGSNISLAINAFKQLDDDMLSSLTIALVDERYGTASHVDSNFYQLKSAGLDLSRVNNLPVLTDKGGSLEETTAEYANALQKLFNSSDHIIGQFGIGPDGHTAGVLPYSPATQATKKLVVGYEADDFSRITITLDAIRIVSKALVFAFGENKREAILNLRDKELSLNEEPAQIFKQLDKAYIINDMIGDKL